MFTWTAIKLLFGSLLKKVMAVIGWLLKHPIVLAAILSLVAGFWLGAHYKAGELKALQAKLKTEHEQALENADNIRKDSETKVKNLAAQVDTLKIDLGVIADLYEVQLNRKPDVKIVKVKVPDTEVVVDAMFEGPNLICRRYPSEYHDTVNELVKQTRKLLNAK